MSLSPEIQQRLDTAREKQYRNPRNKDTLRTIAHRAFVAIEGPFESGKTAISLEVVRLDSDNFHYVPSIMTREPRTDEPANTSRPIENTDEAVSELLDEVEQGKLVQYAIHPTDHTFYGTYPEDYQAGKYNLMPALAGRATDYILESPFKETQVIGIFTDPKTLEQRINNAYRDKSPQKLENRLVEGISSAQFLIEHHKADKLSLLHNVEGQLEKSAQALIDLVNGNRESDEEGIAYLERTVHMFEKMVRDLAANREKND